MLHVVSGFHVQGSLLQARLPGQIIVWWDDLYQGPVPAGLPDAEWRATRAPARAALEEWDPPDMRQQMDEQDAGLERFREHEEVVLWFSSGLSDQLLLIRHLSWFAQRELGTTRLALVSVGETRGRDGPSYRITSVGMLNSDALVPLLASRHEVRAEETRVAQEAWAAFGGPDPRGIEALLGSDTTALLYLHEALGHCLALYPSVRNGLNRAQNQVLARIPRRRGELIQAVGYAMADLEFQFDDAYLAWEVEEMTKGEAPAVKLGPRPVLDHGGTHRLGAMVSLTHVGRNLLAGRADWVRLNGIDRWLGGVHLKGEDAAWRWDDDAGRLAAAAASCSSRPASATTSPPRA